MKQRWWPFPVALLVGLAVGGAYGLFVKLRIEDYWLVVRASGRPVPIWIASVLVGTVLVDLVGAWWGGRRQDLPLLGGAAGARLCRPAVRTRPGTHEPAPAPEQMIAGQVPQKVL